MSSKLVTAVKEAGSSGVSAAYDCDPNLVQLWSNLLSPAHLLF